MSDKPDTTTPAASHLDAAQEFFKTATAESKTEAKVDAKTETTTEAKTATTESKTKLPTFVKTKEVAVKETTTEAKTDVVAPDFDKLVGPDEKSKHRPDWDKMKAAASEQHKARTAAENRLKELEAKLASRGPEQADEATKARIQQLETQIKDYDSKLKVHDLQSHPDFVKQYVEPQKKAVQLINDVLTLEGVTSANVEQILALEGKAFVEAVSKVLPDLSEFNRATVAQAFRDAKKAQADAKVALGNVDQLRQQYSQDFAARSKAAFDAVSRDFSDTLIPIVADEKATDEEKADIEAYNNSLVSLDKQAEALAFGKTDERTVSEMAHKAARFDFMVSQVIPRFAKAAQAEVDRRDARILELETQVKDMTGARPSISGGAGDGGDAGADKKKPTGHLEAAQQYFPQR